MAEQCKVVEVIAKRKYINLHGWCFGNAQQGVCYTSLQCGQVVDLIAEVEWGGYTKAHISLRCNNTKLIEGDVDLGANEGYGFIVIQGLNADELIRSCGLDCYTQGSINFCLEVVGVG